MMIHHKIKIATTTLLILISFQIIAQKNEIIILEQVIIGNDTLPMVTLKPAEITAKDLSGVNDIDATLKYHIRKAYPYALRTGRIVNEVNATLEQFDKKRDDKKYIKETEKILKERFKEDLKNLTRTQGKMLTKLIYRETGFTVHELLQTYKSNISAGWWQMLAKMYNINLKEEYHPETDEFDLSMEKYVLYLDQLYQRSGKKAEINNEEINLPVQGKKRKGKGN
jgi:hypothetical protein